MKRLLHLAFILTLFLFPCLAQNSKSFPDIEKAQIIKAILLGTDFLNKDLQLGETQNIYISRENMPSKFVPEIRGISFVLVNDQEIKEKAKTGFRYYAFEEFKIKNTKVIVSFGSIYRDSGFGTRNQGSSGSPDSTSGIKYEFRKVSGKWLGTKVSGYASAS